MKRAFTISIFVLSGLAATSANADMRELSRGELRENVQLGTSMTLARLLEAVTERVPGELVDVRGFEADHVYFRILIKQPDGKLCAVILDAESGAFVSGDSAVAHEVMAAAQADKSNNGHKSRKGYARGGNSGGSKGGGNGKGGGGKGGGGNGGGGNANGGGGGNGGGKK